MQLYQDIPRTYTALAEWGACLTYLYLAGGITKSRFFMVITPVSLAVQILFLNFTGNLSTIFWIPCMIMAAGLMYICIRLCSDLSALAAGYCCAKAFLLAEFAASLEWQIHTWLQAIGIYSWWTNILLLVLVYGICFIAVFFLERTMFSQEYILQLTLKEVLSAAGMVAAAFAFSNLSFVYGNSPFTSQLKADIFNIRTLIDLGGIAILCAYQSRTCEYIAENELTAIQSILRSQYDQYRNYQDSLELIHMKYHDLKHQIAGLRAETDDQRRKKWLDALEEEISAFGTVNKTGNQVLDTVLAAKIFHCRNNNIQITCIADGKALDFMHVTDLCSVFGNALDNAIENVVLIPEKEKRLIHVSVSSKKDFVFIKIENYCETEIKKNAQQLIHTTKADKQNHGFGLKSICYVIEKYEGSVTFELNNSWFELNILIPKR